MVPSRVAGGLTQQQSSSSSSGIFFQGDSSHLSSSSFANSSNSFPGPTGQRSNLGPVSGGDMNNAVLNSVANSGPSVGASSLVTDANSSLSGGGPHLQRSASINNNNESSYLCLPASPMSFSSNNISISGSSVLDGHHNNHQNQNQNHHQQGASTATSLPTPQGASSLPMGARLPGSPYLQDPIQKKPRLDVKQEDIMQQQVLQQILQRQDSMQFQGRNPQIQALLQQQRMRQQQQMLQSIPQLQRAHHMQQQQQQMQLRQQQMLQQQMQPASPAAAMKRPFDGGVCARRLMQYLYHQRQRPPDNTIAYWRKFVAEYYSPRAKKRWCLSLYENVGHHALGVFPQASMDAWHCDLCGSKSGRGFEATSEVLPRLNEIKFGSGVIDELLFLDLPRESRSPSGIMMLEYAKAVQESVYEQLRVVREGQLRIIFTQDLKILSWEFCARRHEELLPRRLVAPQVNQLVQVAQKCQNTITESGSEGVSQQDLQTNSNMVLSAGRQLAKSLELQSLNDLGFSKRYVRCLQISEVVNSMKDLIDFCREHKAGPIDGLKNYPRHSSAAKLQMQKMQEMEQLANAQGIPTDRNTLNKLMALHPGMNSNQMGNNNHLMGGVGVGNNRGGGGGALSGPAQAALALTNYQNLHHMRQNSMPNSVALQQQEASSSFNNNPTQSPSSSSFQMPGGGSSMHSSPHHPTHQHQQQQRSMSANAMLQHHSPQTSQGNNNHQVLQHQMIQQLLQEISSGGPSHSGGPTNSNGMGFAGAAQSGGNNNGPPSRSNSFKSASNSEAHQRAPPDLPANLHLQDDITQEFAENGFFGGDMDDSMGYGWKA